MVLVEAFEAIRNNVGGIATRLLQFWSELKSHFTVIGKILAPVAHLFSGEGAVGKFFQTVLVFIMDRLMDVANAIMVIIETTLLAVKKIYEHPTRVFDLVSVFSEAFDEARAMFREERRFGMGDIRFAERALGAREVPSGRPQNNFDFRGSRFDITQSFAEGFDPDRIAVAFANDIAALGERKVTGQFVPPFSP
jgi:hypothetical protein